MKNAKFALFSKGKVHSCGGKKSEIYLTFIFMQNTPRKVSGDVLVPSYSVFSNSPKSKFCLPHPILHKLLFSSAPGTDCVFLRGFKINNLCKTWWRVGECRVKRC